MYEILDHGSSDFYRLDAIDSKPRNYIHEQTGRFGLNLHRPGSINFGCIAATDKAEWEKAKDLLQHTKTIEVEDMYHSIQLPLIQSLVPDPKPFVPHKVKKYGNLFVTD